MSFYSHSNGDVCVDGAIEVPLEERAGKRVLATHLPQTELRYTGAATTKHKWE